MPRQPSSGPADRSPLRQASAPPRISPTGGSDRKRPATTGEAFIDPSPFRRSSDLSYSSIADSAISMESTAAIAAAVRAGVSDAMEAQRSTPRKGRNAKVTCPSKKATNHRVDSVSIVNAP